MCFFPLVGLAQGAVLGLWLHFALDVLNLSAAVSALVGAAVPLLVTGGIHMDGFLDTWMPFIPMVTEAESWRS